MLRYVKTGLSNTDHAFKFAQYAQRNRAEFQYRFNRRFDLRSSLAPMVLIACITKPHALAVRRG